MSLFRHWIRSSNEPSQNHHSGSMHITPGMEYHRGGSSNSGVPRSDLDPRLTFAASSSGSFDANRAVDVGYNPAPQPYSPATTSKTRTTSDSPCILVFGLTGAGKSSLVQRLTGDDGVKIGNRLESETQISRVYTCKNPVNGVFFQYLDTPGFDDTTRISLDVLEGIIGGIHDIRKIGLSIAGVIYVHRILDDRVSGSSRNCIDVLKQVCGSENYGRIAVVASHWDTMTTSTQGTQKGNQRMNELRSHFLADLSGKGALFTVGNENVKFSLEQFFLQNWNSNMKLKIEDELERGIGIHFTGAGKIVVDAMDKKIKELEDGLKLLGQMADATPDPDNRQDVLREIEKVRRILYGYSSKRQQINARVGTTKEPTYMLAPPLAQPFAPPPLAQMPFAQPQLPQLLAQPFAQQLEQPLERPLERPLEHSLVEHSLEQPFEDPLPGPIAQQPQRTLEDLASLLCLKLKQLKEQGLLDNLSRDILSRLTPRQEELLETMLVVFKQLLDLAEDVTKELGIQEEITTATEIEKIFRDCNWE